MDNNEKVSLLDKRAEDITVRDNLKLFAIGAAAFVAIPVVINGVALGVTKLSEVRRARRLEKSQKD